MIKTIPTDRMIRRMPRRTTPATKTPTFYYTPPKSNPVVKHTFVAKIGGIKNEGYGMNVMKWVDRKEFGTVAEAINKAEEMIRTTYIGLPHECIVEESVSFSDGSSRIKCLHSWTKDLSRGFYSDWSKNA